MLRSVPLFPSSWISAVLETVSKPSGGVSVTCTAKVTLLLIPLFRVLSAKVYCVLESTCCQPMLLWVGSKLVFSGNVSISSTPLAPWFPWLAYARVYINTSPGFTRDESALLVRVKSGAATSVVLRFTVLLVKSGSTPLLESSKIVNIPEIVSTPEGTLSVTMTENNTLEFVSASKEPKEN